MAIDPQAQAVIDLIVKSGRPAYNTLSPKDARQLFKETRPASTPTPPQIGEVRDMLADSVAVRVYRPAGVAADTPLPALVFFHGGGWVIGDLDTHDVLCRQLANQSGCAVVAVDYRLGPEHRFPAAVDDALAATSWVHGNAAALQVDPSRIAVGGDSAGGNLAAVVALAARDAADLPIAFQLLVYPATDQRRGWPSHTTNGQGYLLTKDSMDYYHDHYLVDARHDLDWRASPLLHSDHAKLPPALVLTAGYDPLRDEGMQYAHKLSEAGSRATLVNFERQLHGFITMGRVIDEANAAVEICAAQLRNALRP